MPPQYQLRYSISIGPVGTGRMWIVVHHNQGKGHLDIPRSLHGLIQLYNSGTPGGVDTKSKVGDILKRRIVTD